MEASLRTVIGSSYLGLGLADPALTQLSRALDLAEASPDVPTLERRVASNRLIGALLSKNRFWEARAIGTTALRLCREQLGPEHPETVLSASHLARSYDYDAKRAIAIYRKTLEGLRQSRGPNDRLTLTAAHGLAQALVRSKQLEEVKEAEAIERSLAELAPHVFGPDHPTTLSIHGALGRALVRQRKNAEAKAILEPLQDRYTRVFGPDNPNLAGPLSDLGRLAEQAKKYEEALALYLRASAVCHERYSINLIHYGELTISAARVDMARGRAADAVSRLQRIVYYSVPILLDSEGMAQAMAGTTVPKKDQQCLIYLMFYTLELVLARGLDGGPLPQSLGLVPAPPG